MASMRSSVSETGCKPPWLRCRPGKLTSSASALSCFSSSALPSAWRRALRATSIACLARLTAAPRDFFSSTLSAAMPFISSVTRPDLPKNSALAFSRSAGVMACAKLSSALLIRLSSGSVSFIKTLVRNTKTMKKGQSFFKLQPSIVHSFWRQSATFLIAGCSLKIRRPAWLSPVQRWRRKQRCRGWPYQTAPCGQSRYQLFSSRWQTGCRSNRKRGLQR